MSSSRKTFVIIIIAITTTGILFTLSEQLDENKNKILDQIYFDAKGYYADDVRLTTGHIPLATLNTTKSEQQILQELSKYDLVQDFILI